MKNFLKLKLFFSPLCFQELLNSEILLPQNTPQSAFFGFPNNKENFEIINRFYLIFYPNKAGLFEGNFFKKNLSNINITLCNC